MHNDEGSHIAAIGIIILILCLLDTVKGDTE